jgi:UDP-N-acetylmuramate--alanine ligase
MIDLRKTSTFYFLGIGGIGMSALARYFHACGKRVGGYDKTPTRLTEELQGSGIMIHFDDDIGFFKERLKGDKSTVIVYTPAVPPDHSELVYFRENGYRILKRSEVLGLITQNTNTLAVAGTHGKTTTTSIIAHLLSSSGSEISAFLGGIAKNYNSNLILSETLKAGGSPSDIVVVEADEYDRSFLHLHPQTAVITSLDPDHLDIYGTRENMEESYNEFASQVKRSLIVKRGLRISAPHSTYSIKEDADFYGSRIRVEQGNYLFDFTWSGGSFHDLMLGVPGIHNVENAVAAIAVACVEGISEEKIRNGLASYAGVKRRFDYRIKSRDMIYMDDYAHHPEELRACIRSVRELYPDKRITGVFQPHLYSRTRDFAAGFAESLSMLDELILLDIYPARELPVPGVKAEIILDKVTIPSKQLCAKEELLSVLEKKDVEVLLTLGAGDIDTLVEPITQLLNEKRNEKSS